ncbi:dolichyl pyrophosphate Glc1Man9GlcNAc2 alpha-1,3-glucosyltransferase [Epargyreus clarus]|uniref:dolichyl pyrophosphate Glc1Man9GlcNAc2 alpha-1,3-glucosyltransferase n=1 Tax=Epargyreus clarus TaxID=520877 RepID=UPI003C2B84AA
MLLQIALIVSTVKLFFIPLYHSTDFEVHRNWLAITHNVSIDKWYYESTSEWTLDYPPFFAWFQYGLSHIAKIFDPEMLKLENLNYDSPMTILFQRLSVIVLDIVYIYGIKSCSTLVSNGKALVFILLVSNPGLLIVDHIHFQYNGFLYGFLLFSMSNMIKAEYIQAAIWFAVLLNMKHIFLYVAPVYIVFLLRSYCFILSTTDGVHTPWHSFSIINLFKLAVTVGSIFIICYGPFVDHIPQILSRLFPFKRGLCHAYWAPNFWALYNIADKVLQYLLPMFGYSVPKSEASMTGGLVQEYKHTVLPNIKPEITFALTALSMVPALIKLWHLGADRRYRNLSFIRCMIVCATCSFMFGWHVHEKAILMVLIPLSFMSVLGEVDGRNFLIMSTVGHYSLFPLLYPKNLLLIKIFMLLTHSSISFSNIPSLYEIPRVKGAKKPPPRGFLILPGLNRIESLYLYGLLIICMYENVLHSILGLDKVLPFLPLMITSVYCAIGIFYSWICYYHYFITFNVCRVPIMVSGQSSLFAKKVT